MPPKSKTTAGDDALDPTSGGAAVAVSPAEDLASPVVADDPGPAAPAPEEQPHGQEPSAPPYASPRPEPGWWRNVGETAVQIVGEGVGLTLSPGRIAPLPWKPSHRFLAPASRADFDAQEAADAAANAPAHPETGAAAGPATATPGIQE